MEKKIAWGDFTLVARLGTKRGLVVRVFADDTPLTSNLNFDEMQATAFFGPLAEECAAAHEVMEFVKEQRRTGQMESVEAKRERLFQEKEARRKASQGSQWAALKEKFDLS